MNKINDVTKLRRDHALDLSRRNVKPSSVIDDVLDLRDANRQAISGHRGTIDLRTTAAEPEADNFFEVMTTYIPGPTFPRNDSLILSDSLGDADNSENARRWVVAGVIIAAMALGIIAAIIAIFVSYSNLGSLQPAGARALAPSISKSASPVPSSASTPGPTALPTSTTTPKFKAVAPTAQPAVAPTPVATPVVGGGCVPDPAHPLCLPI